MKMVTIVEAKYIPVKMQLYWFIFSWLLQNLAFWEPMQSNPNITDQIYHSDVTSCLDPLQKWVTLWLFANRYFFYLKKVKSQYSQNYISDCATNYISDSHRICYFLGHILSFKRKKKRYYLFIHRCHIRWFWTFIHRKWWLSTWPRTRWDL